MTEKKRETLKRYQKKAKKNLVIVFYPGDYALLDEIRAKADEEDMYASTWMKEAAKEKLRESK